MRNFLTALLLATIAVIVIVELAPPAPPIFPPVIIEPTEQEPLVIKPTPAPVPKPAPKPAPPRVLGWSYSTAKTNQLAKELRRPILLAFGRDACQPCEAVKRSAYSDQDTLKRIGSELVPQYCHTSLDDRGRPIDNADYRMAVKHGAHPRYPRVVVIGFKGKCLFVPSADVAAFNEQLDEALERVSK